MSAAGVILSLPVFGGLRGGRPSASEAGGAAGPALSAMPRCRRSAQKRRPVAMGQQETFETFQNAPQTAYDCVVVTRDVLSHFEREDLSCRFSVVNFCI